ncbi:MAG TPA: hypothetical protein VF141_19455, partial [Chryseolinea sp.]
QGSLRFEEKVQGSFVVKRIRIRGGDYKAYFCAFCAVSDVALRSLVHSFAFSALKKSHAAVLLSPRTAFELGDALSFDIV